MLYAILIIRGLINSSLKGFLFWAKKRKKKTKHVYLNQYIFTSNLCENTFSQIRLNVSFHFINQILRNQKLIILSKSGEII